MSAEGSGPPRTSWALVRDPTFGRFVGVNLLSNVGTWFHDVAAAIVIFELTGSATMVAGVAISGYGTALLLAPLGGQLADRFDRRRLLIASHLVLAAVTMVLSVLVQTERYDSTILLGLTAVIGVGRAVNSPALSALVPALVPRVDLAPALALHAVTFHMARAVGPFLGASTLAVAGPAAAFAINALSFGVFALVMRGIVTERRPRPTGSGTGLLAGVRYVGSRRGLLLVLVLGTITGMGSDPVITLGPSIAADLGRGEGFVGALVSAFGIGAISAAPFLARLRTTIGGGRTGIAAMFGLAVGLGGLAAAPGAASALVGAFVGGFAFLVAATDLMTVAQEMLDDEVRGRVMALWTMGFLGSRPLAAALNGSIADRTSTGVAIGVMATLIAVVATAGAASYHLLYRAPGEA